MPLATNRNTPDTDKGFKRLEIGNQELNIDGYLCRCGKWHDKSDPEYREHWYLNAG